MPACAGLANGEAESMVLRRTWHESRLPITWSPKSPLPTQTIYRWRPPLSSGGWYGLYFSCKSTTSLAPDTNRRHQVCPKEAYLPVLTDGLAPSTQTLRARLATSTENPNQKYAGSSGKHSR